MTVVDPAIASRGRPSRHESFLVYNEVPLSQGCLRRSPWCGRGLASQQFPEDLVKRGYEVSVRGWWKFGGKRRAECQFLETPARA
jgi:hypothetical protein